MLFVFFCIFLSTFALIKQGEFHRVHSPKEAVPEALLGLAEPLSGDALGVTAESHPSPCSPVDSLTLLWLRGVGGSGLAKSGSLLSPSAPA